MPDRSREVLDVGRRTRTIPPALRRALDVRDGGCRFPGCGLRFTEAHHIEHWADGGVTKLDNLLLLCRHHHRLVHEEGWRVAWVSGFPPEFTSPTGRTVRRGMPLGRAGNPSRDASGNMGGDPGRVRGPTDSTAVADPADALVGFNERCGVLPDWRTASARWKREADTDWNVVVRAMGD